MAAMAAQMLLAANGREKARIGTLDRFIREIRGKVPAIAALTFIHLTQFNAVLALARYVK
jgi:hypothetical protein